MPGALRQSDAGESLRYSPPALALRHPPQQERVFDVFRGRKYRNQVEGLEYETDLFAAQGRRGSRPQRGGLGAIHQNPPARGAIDTADQIQQRRFAASARSCDGEKLSPVYPQGYVFERRHRTVIQHVMLAHALDTD